jgi:hypothetical protein
MVYVCIEGGEVWLRVAESAEGGEAEVGEEPLRDFSALAKREAEAGDLLFVFLPASFDSSVGSVGDSLPLRLPLSVGEGGESGGNGRKDCRPSASSMRRKAVTTVHPEWILPSDSSLRREMRLSTLWNVSFKTSGIVALEEVRSASRRYYT